MIMAIKFKILVVVLFTGTFLYSLDIERRKDQYSNTPGYLITPAPYSIPGIGDGLFILGMATNINNTQTDFLIDYITGDVRGYGIGLMEWYPINKYLKIDIFNEGLDKATIQSYSSRGMNSNKDDYIYIGIDKLKFTGLRATGTFYDKMLEFYLMGYRNEYLIDNLKDRDNNLILDTSNNKIEKSTIYTTGLNIDYTDDKIDPRVGLRFDYSVDYSENNEQDEADFYVSNYNLTGYIPIGKHSTWAFNYFRSDSHIKRVGDTDFNSVSSKLGMNCDSIENSIDKINCQNVVNNYIDANRYGTATSLGGRTRLRSYPEMRFQGAHTQFYGTEFRWNMTDEITPFNIWIMKDIRTTIQTAVFYEKGSVAENISNLGKDEKSSYGIGVRMVTGSGLVYRLDTAWGDEDFAVTVIINYPWENF